MESYNTLVEALEGLEKEGYSEEFNLKQDYLESSNGKFQIRHHEFEIDKFFRFEGETDPSDESIVYAISSAKYNLKGVLVSAYGIYSEPLVDEMIKKFSFAK
ncbi:phosphoribosylpyrophosphate synthetase [Dyadobacter subterraneus]|uniref:Phosphoribosylpyrophosphate synthetase n=1 Tax=Dyadobacter subterraneus TaxID=2773304 RepID=A0ABR9W7T2_9BACT|nr:phosphoribosylpyrophosphate synthetase [Dyadobacter subterraneus]MBE9460461.1 phosphoribosylpyrophosphate synthetase [Dyadobacter subterraneus]